MLAAGTVLFFFGCSWWGRYQPVSLDRAAPVSFQAEIKGEVENPGVYELKTGSDVEDLIAAAGEVTESADLSSVSLMKKLEDNEVVVIPALREPQEKERISINTADEETLQQLPGIGPAIAGRIVDYRNEQSFSSLEDIMNVKGIGEKMFEKIRDEICL